MRLGLVLLLLAACGEPASSVAPGSNVERAVGGAAGVAPQLGTTIAGAGAGGRGNEAGASGAGGTRTMLTLKQPIDRGDGKLVLELGSTYFEVTPRHGARISSLRHGGVELLTQTGASNYADATGSTFWPSPQTWPWPPPAEIDNGPYAVRVDASGVISLEGASSSATSLQVSKRFSADLAREAIRLEYAMTNTSGAPVMWAPWEITRMPASGLAFWPTGGEPFGPQPMRALAAAGHTWCDPSQTDGEGKLFADGAGGYLAYLVGDRLLIKQFQDQPTSAIAPNEAEIELYVNPDHSYVEVEQQGAYASIPPGNTVRWQVSWYVRKLPTGVVPSIGNPDLVAFVAETLE